MVNDNHNKNMVLPNDWQTTKCKVAQRSQYLLEMGQWADCKFVVGQEPNQQIVEGHKVFLAMSSPVFETMFYGGMAQKDEPIPVKDVQPQAFKALLEYIYTDRVALGSFDLACELCYCAKKYMLPFLVQECIKFLWADLSPKNVCRAYEFAKLLDEPALVDKCLHIMRSRTDEVIHEPSWLDVEEGTVLAILDENELKVASELDLFNALEKWAVSQCRKKSLDAADSKSLKSVIGDSLSKIRFLTFNPQEFAEGPAKSLLLSQEEAFALLMNISSRKCEQSIPEGFSPNTNKRVNLLSLQIITDISTKLPQQVNIYNKRPRDCEERPINLITSTSFLPMSIPEEQSNSINEPVAVRWQVEPENNASPINNPPQVVHNEQCEISKHVCVRTVEQQAGIYNDSQLECNVTFIVDKNICVLGLQVPSQILEMDINSQPVAYTELLYAHLLDSFGTRLTYTHLSTRVSDEGLIEVFFNRPVYVQKNKVYTVGVVFNQPGWYPLARCSQNRICDNVAFRFGAGNSAESQRDGLIRSIIFTSR